MKTKAKKLSALPFGDRNSLSGLSLDSAAESISLGFSGDYDIAPLSAEIHHKTTAINIGEMHILAGALTPFLVKGDRLPFTSLGIPTSGQCCVTANKRKYYQRTGHTAFLLSSGRSETVTGDGYAGVYFDVQKSRLEHTLRAMTGLESTRKFVNSAHEQDREVPLRAAGISFDKLLRSYFAQIDLLQDQPQALALLGLDDTLYRTFAMMLLPELFLIDNSKSNKKVDQRNLEQVCNYIQANLDKPLALSELEHISGLSARSLQYGFQRRFGCTPTQWIREQRLTLAHNRLKLATSCDRVTGIALSCGFTHMGVFGRDYYVRFGERPSETLARAQNC
ncbi:AraC family transcriptional regulator [Candidatus Methylospira mobilis]|nr:AraC family transcriptional regulator [Candidatus Methylospira mobilis]